MSGIEEESGHNPFGVGGFASLPQGRRKAPTLGYVAERLRRTSPHPATLDTVWATPACCRTPSAYIAAPGDARHSVGYACMLQNAFGVHRRTRRHRPSWRSPAPGRIAGRRGRSRGVSGKDGGPGGGSRAGGDDAGRRRSPDALQRRRESDGQAVPQGRREVRPGLRVRGSARPTRLTWNCIRAYSEVWPHSR